MTIRFFSKSDRYREFSNFANYPIEIDGVVWPTSEHYYQAQKFDDPAHKTSIRGLSKAGAAKRYASKYKRDISPDWGERKDAVMERALRAKFTQHKSLRDLLTGSGDERIEEDSQKDYYWGTGADGAGQNKLGTMLMQLRADLRESSRVNHAHQAVRPAWLAPLSRLAEMGISQYPRATRRRLKIVNVMALMIALFSVIYAAVFTVFGIERYWPLIVLNLGLAVVAALAPLAHRINDIAAALIICAAEYAALFFFVRELGHDSGIQLNYIIAAAVAFAIYDRTRIGLSVAVIAIGLALHLATWFLYPAEAARIEADPFLLHNLYVSSAATSFCIIGLIVGYAFAVADRARAEADSLLENILPKPIAERLKTRPGERVADAVPSASVMFSDLVGFTELAQDLGAARTVEILDRLVSEFDRLAALHGVEKIKTIGDGYMAVAGVSAPQHDHAHRLARLALALPGAVAEISAMHGVDLRIRVGLASGPVMAGVIGTDKFSYDVWGETVNLAARLESHGLPGEIQVAGDLYQALRDSYAFERRGPIAIKGVGTIKTWFLKGESPAEQERAP